METFLIIAGIVLAVIFATIPITDWGVVALYMAMSACAFYGCMVVFPDPFHIMAFAWIAVGQGVLVKEKIMLPYPKTLKGSLASFGRAVIWPKYCLHKD
jgi:hypothetical protein